MTLRDWLEEAGTAGSAWQRQPAPQALAARA
jgi:hypothetical protein